MFILPIPILAVLAGTVLLLSLLELPYFFSLCIGSFFDFLPKLCLVAAFVIESPLDNSYRKFLKNCHMLSYIWYAIYPTKQIWVEPPFGLNYSNMGIVILDKLNSISFSLDILRMSFMSRNYITNKMLRYINFAGRQYSPTFLYDVQNTLVFHLQVNISLDNKACNLHSFL